jgi:hypothetical protein
MKTAVRGVLYTNVQSGIDGNGTTTVLCTGTRPDSLKIFSGVVVASTSGAPIGKYCEYWAKESFIYEPEPITITSRIL